MEEKWNSFWSSFMITYTTGILLPIWFRFVSFFAIKKKKTKRNEIWKYKYLKIDAIDWHDWHDWWLTIDDAIIVAIIMYGWQHTYNYMMMTRKSCDQEKKNFCCCCCCECVSVQKLWVCVCVLYDDDNVIILIIIINSMMKPFFVSDSRKYEFIIYTLIIGKWKERERVIRFVNYRIIIITLLFIYKWYISTKMEDETKKFCP